MFATNDRCWVILVYIFIYLHAVYFEIVVIFVFFASGVCVSESVYITSRDYSSLQCFAVVIDACQNTDNHYNCDRSIYILLHSFIHSSICLLINIVDYCSYDVQRLKHWMNWWSRPFAGSYGNTLFLIKP